MAVAALSVPEDSSTVPSCAAHHGQSDGRLRIRMKRRRATTTVATGTATTVSAPTSATVTAASCDLILAALALVQVCKIRTGGKCKRRDICVVPFQASSGVI